MRPLPTPRQLRYLVTVAETLHFGQAAERCHVTQSTLSAGIRELETLLGATLIERQTRRQVVITPLGRDIVDRAERLLADIESLVDAAQVGMRPLSGLFRLGVIPTIGPYVMPLALPALRRAYPDLRLYLREDPSTALLDALAAGRLDAALLAQPFDLRGNRGEELGQEDVMVALPADHPLAAGTHVAEADLSTEPLLTLEDGHCLRDHALAACHLDGGRGSETFQATSLNTLTQMVAGGLGFTLLPRIAVAREVAPGSGVVVRPLAGRTTPARRLVLCWRPGVAHERNQRLLAAALREACREAIDDGEAAEAAPRGDATA
ncbi:hydrogen peroxide-inducible genes activator [Roseospira visakhapatnamensis]|uniref:LysR family hydrogen peroxide-inducible transcriptional activator n=1 Tax=Roseospira visakhapatnamensis TaxID=390880 RepID=A0A7W6WAA1_9PROT|nr:hydrogen peroxide-inducible genes activator [Roseospira visakhapatnamensis]MBB4266643.1 LysR family hydrogen peroxide-inducible transcriptional activator [Roseospira visakhapatnamensis]